MYSFKRNKEGNASVWQQLLAYTTSHRLPSISKQSQMKTRLVLVEVRIGVMTLCCKCLSIKICQAQEAPSCAQMKLSPSNKTLLTSNFNVLLQDQDYLGLPTTTTVLEEYRRALLIVKYYD
jgi:hypothetical protein